MTESNEELIARVEAQQWSQVGAVSELVRRLAEAVGDRNKAEAMLEMVKALADGYSWLAEGRGCYEYDDGRYDDDVRLFTNQLLELLPSSAWLGMREWEAKYRSQEAQLAEKDAEIARLLEYEQTHLDNLSALRKRACICDDWPGNYEGYRFDCPVHGQATGAPA